MMLPGFTGSLLTSGLGLGLWEARHKENEETGKRIEGQRSCLLLVGTSPAALSLPRPPFYSAHPSFGPHPVAFLVAFLPWHVCWVTIAQSLLFSWPQFTHLKMGWVEVMVGEFDGNPGTICSASVFWSVQQVLVCGVESQANISCGRGGAVQEGRGLAAAGVTAAHPSFFREAFALCKPPPARLTQMPLDAVLVRPLQGCLCPVLHGISYLVRLLGPAQGPYVFLSLGSP